MIRVDPRTGSGDLQKHLTGIGHKAQLVSMEFGDVAFTGNGPEGRPVLVGVEVKTVTDLLACIRDGRFAGHQLPGLAESYEDWWLVVEGGVRPGHEDVRPGVRQLVINLFGRWFAPDHFDRMAYSDLMHWIFTLVYRAGGKVWFTRDRMETVHWLGSLYTWWNDPKKTYEQHDSCVAMHEDTDLQEHQVALIRATRKMKVAKQLPGIGAKKAFFVAQFFPSIRKMVNATEAEWRKIEGVGKKLAAEIVAAVTEETKW